MGNWTIELAMQLNELKALDKVTRKAIAFMEAAGKADMTPTQLASTIASKNRYQDRTMVRAAEFAEQHGGTLKPFKPHEDGVIYAWDILIPLDSKYKLLIEVDRTEDVEHWTDPLLFQARVFTGPRKKHDRYGKMITHSFKELARKKDLADILKEAQAYVQRGKK